jgi:hypothetical protein
MSKALYFRATPSPGFPCDHEETCTTLAVHRQAMQDNGETERLLYRAVPDRSNQYFWCHQLQEVGTKEDGGCGLQCKHYAPRNGRSGRCRHHGHCYTADHERSKILRCTPTVEENADQAFTQ